MDIVESAIVNTFKSRFNTRIFKVLVRLLGTRPGTVCLEVGCGKGDMAYRLVETINPEKYLATDYDNEQLERAKSYITLKRNGTGFPGNLELRTADALGLPFSDNCFDSVFAFSVLHHTENHFWFFRNIPRALREVARVLKPHGIFVYEEYVHHRKIRDNLASMGFRVVYRRRFWFFAEVVVAVKDTVSATVKPG